VLIKGQTFRNCNSADELVKRLGVTELDGTPHLHGPNSGTIGKVDRLIRGRCVKAVKGKDRLGPCIYFGNDALADA
jgi:hypothetical protein